MKLIFLPLTSKEPPSCGDVSDTKSVSIPVRFAPLIAGKVEGNLASGIVPDVKFDALKAVKSIVSNVGSAPLLALKTFHYC
ncbi:MAG: hypothetical protein CM15mV75_470 [uncultured marine virus]|nr:MAG: hypothetical protein CM15mV75_470 [uncultured marine virus]